MFRVKISGWQRGLQKIAMTKAIRKRAEIDLAEAKRHTDAVLQGQETIIILPNRASAKKLADELVSYGAIAESIDD